MAHFHQRLIQRLTRILRGDGLKARAAKSTFWTIGGMATSQLLRLASNLVLTRLLFPEAFGLMALVQIFITGLAMFSDIGIRASIIQNSRSHEPGFLNTAWTLQVLRGVILWLFACAIAWPAASFYDDPRLAQLLPVAGLTALIAGFSPTRIHTANRDLVLGRLTLIEIASQVINIAMMITLALLMRSVWALVFGNVLGAITKQLLLVIFMPGHHNRLQIDRSALGELIHFGKWIFLSTVCGFVANQADRAILGKFVSLEMLGIYSVGFFLASVPMMLARPLATKIVFPLYKQRPPSESEENKRKIFMMRRIMTGALLSLSAVLALSGDLLVGFLYDPRYALAGPILVLVSIAQMPVVILSSYGSLMLAAGDSRRFLQRVFATAVAQSTVLVAGILQFGIIGATVATGISALIVYPLLIRSSRLYGGWDWVHDLIFGVIALLIALVALDLNWDAIQRLLEYSLS